MRKTIFVFCVLLASLSCALTASAQDSHSPGVDTSTEPAHFYHLKFVVQQLDADGKITNSRSYFTTVSTANKGYSNEESIRTDSQVPYPSTTNRFDYVDVGIDFDIHDVNDLGRQLSLHVKAAVRSYLPPAIAGASAISCHNQWESSLLIPIGKPTVIFTSDSLDSKGAMQVVATATPIP